MPDPESPLHSALAKVGDRWTLLVIDALRVGPGRFSDLQTTVVGISPNILSARLRTLEADGLVVARTYQERPPRFEYTLTATGKELAGAIDLLAAWGSRHGEAVSAPRHDLCGTPLEVRWYCPTCNRVATAADEGWQL